ncbi:MAG: recombinase family protein [Rhodospirillales bacterium]
MLKKERDGGFPAKEIPAARVLALLLEFRRINPKQPDAGSPDTAGVSALAIHNQRVTVRYRYNVSNGSRDRIEFERGLRRINPAEAGFVLRIFEEYAAGKSPRRIAFGLNADNVPGPSGKAWGPSTINGNRTRGTGILNNELYVGRLVWNRLKYVRNPDTGKRISRLNPPEEWIVHEVPELRIVPDELWSRVKARQNAVKRNTRPDCKAPKPFWKQTRPKYLFSGLMKCGLCGGSYTKISANLFGCATARNKRTCTNRLNIRCNTLEETVLDGLKHHLMDPDLFKEFADEFYREVNRLRMAESAKFHQAGSELATIDRKLRKIVDAITDGVPARTLKDELLTLETRKEELERQLASQKDPEPLIHPNLAEVYRQKVASLQQALHEESHKAEVFELIRSLVDDITFTPENGELRVDLRGELAGILNLCSDKQKPASELRDGLEQIKMVAGAGFEPATFRL